MTVVDRFAAARAVADAVLYEGYVLYPYRASAQKNQVRWQWGVLVPPGLAGAGDGERSSVRTECIVDPGPAPAVHVRLRCLQTQRRTVERSTAAGFEPVASLDVGDRRIVSWDEAIEHEIDIPALRLLPVADARTEHALHLPAGEEVEVLTDDSGAVVGRVVRSCDDIVGRVVVEAEWADAPGALLLVRVVVENTSPWSAAAPSRDRLVAHSLVAMHTVLAIDDGVFLSSLDPPAFGADAVAGCSSAGTFPVLVGSAQDLVLSSPIILYDQPQIAPESVGDLFDATEIDEILALRVLTLTDEEKAEARGTDRRAAAIVDRCDAMPPEVWERLHGAVRSIESVPTTAPELPWWEPGVDAAFDPHQDRCVVQGREVTAGTRVRLAPNRRADAHDMFLAGLDATVVGVFTDVDDNVMVSVTVDGDPAGDELAWRGRGYFFHPDELEVR